MKLELDLIKAYHEAVRLRLGLPEVMDQPSPDKARAEQAELGRKWVRLETDALIHEGLLRSDRAIIARRSAETMLKLAGTLAMIGLEPNVDDLVYAAKELIEDARIPIEKGLHQREWSDVKIGAVMVELVIRGLCSAINVPYESVLREVHRADLQGLVDGSHPDRVPDVAGVLDGRVREPGPRLAR